MARERFRTDCGTFVETAGGGLTFAQLTDNTYYLSRGFAPDLGQAINLVPGKIKKRLTLNKAGLNGLATTIISPEVFPVLNEDLLTQILINSNQVNKKIGLPEAKSLVIRSARSSIPSIRNAGSVSPSEPMLLAINVAGHDRKFIAKVKGETKKFSRFTDYVSSLAPNTFFIIHDDNEKLQAQAVHAKLMENSEGAEINLGTQTLHARELDNPENGKPSIRINASRIEDITSFGNHYSFDSRTVLRGFGGEKRHTTALNGTSFAFYNIDYFTANKLLRVLVHDKYLLTEAFTRAKKLFVNTAVVELRDYQISEGGVGRKLHVLDVDTNF